MWVILSMSLLDSSYCWILIISIFIMESGIGFKNNTHTYSHTNIIMYFSLSFKRSHSHLSVLPSPSHFSALPSSKQIISCSWPFHILSSRGNLTFFYQLSPSERPSIYLILSDFLFLASRLNSTQNALLLYREWEKMEAHFFSPHVLSPSLAECSEEMRISEKNG